MSFEANGGIEYGTPAQWAQETAELGITTPISAFLRAPRMNTRFFFWEMELNYRLRSSSSISVGGWLPLLQLMNHPQPCISVN